MEIEHPKIKVRFYLDVNSWLDGQTNQPSLSFSVRETDKPSYLHKRYCVTVEVDDPLFDGADTEVDANAE